MRFIKRLIIMSGEGSATLNVEKNGAYCNVRLACFFEKIKGELVLLIDGKKHFHDIKAKNENFRMEVDGELNAVHAAIFSGEKLIVYGTNEPHRMTYQQVQTLRPKPKVMLELNEDKLFSKRGEIAKQEFVQEAIKEQIKETEDNQQYKDDEICLENYYPESFFEKEMKNDIIKERDMNELPYKKDANYLYALNNSIKSGLENMPKYQDNDVLNDAIENKKLKPEIKRETNALKNNEKQKVQEIEKEIHIAAREGTFYERMGEDIEKIFSSAQPDKELEEILPNSKWVRIEYNNSGRFYCLGMIGKEYLCYGVPADFSPMPPEELKGYCWWLPLKPDKPKEKGYWIMYQNLKTGEAVLP